MVCFISRIRFTSHNRRNNHKEVQQRGGEVGGEGRVAARGREARYGSWLQAHSGRSSLWSPADSLALGRAMVFVRKCASDCRLKYDSHPIRFDLGPHARETAPALARPPANRTDGRTDGQNRAWGFVWRNARFIMRPSKHMPAQRRAIEPSPPCRSPGGSSMYNRWWHNRKQQADRGRKRGDLSIDRHADPARLRKCASQHRRHPSSGQLE